MSKLDEYLVYAICFVLGAITYFFIPKDYQFHQIKEQGIVTVHTDEVCTVYKNSINSLNNINCR